MGQGASSGPAPRTRCIVFFRQGNDVYTPAQGPPDPIRARFGPLAPIPPKQDDYLRGGPTEATHGPGNAQPMGEHRPQTKTDTRPHTAPERELNMSTGINPSDTAKQFAAWAESFFGNGETVQTEEPTAPESTGNDDDT